MGAYSGPEISNDSLVLAYDMGNTQKSWRGAPTTNLANVGLFGVVAGVTVTFLGTENGWKKYSLSGTFTDGTYPYTMRITAVSFTGGVSYSSSCYVKTNVMSKFNYFGTGMNYVNQPKDIGGTSFGVLQNDGSYYCGTSNFAYTSTTTQSGYMLSNPINNTTFNSSTDFVWLYNGQIELGEFPTPFAGEAGTRTNTQAILDLTGNNTITANSLTYASDGTFSFNGTDNLAVIPNNTALDVQTPSVEVWIKTNVISQNGFWFEKGTVNTQYSLFQQGSAILWRQRFTSGVLSQVSVTTSTYINTANWYQVVGTFVSGSRRLYINGNLVSSDTESGTIATNSGGMSIGVYGGFSGARGYYYNGNIASCRVYDRELTANEVKQNFYALKGRFGI